MKSLKTSGNLETRKTPSSRRSSNAHGWRKVTGGNATKGLRDVAIHFEFYSVFFTVGS